MLGHMINTGIVLDKVYNLVRGSHSKERRNYKKYIIASSTKCHTGLGEECVGREQRITRGHVFMVVRERPPW